VMLSGLLWPLILLIAYAVFVWYLWRETGGTSWARSEPATTKQPERTDDAQQRVLFVCTHNSARSQMAEALLRQAAGARFVVASAGTEPTRVHPLAEQVMAERGLSLGFHRAKSIADVGTYWDYVITVCDAAFERCPEFPDKTSRLHWSLGDPSQATGTDLQQIEAFRRVRDDLAERITRWVADQAERP
jgi:arsenate reductase (thioredoxin)